MVKNTKIPTVMNGGNQTKFTYKKNGNRLPLCGRDSLSLCT
jgi:hypothetical protein